MTQLPRTRFRILRNQIIQNKAQSWIALKQSCKMTEQELEHFKNMKCFVGDTELHNALEDIRYSEMLAKWAQEQEEIDNLASDKA